jgi:CcmD family protein
MTDSTVPYLAAGFGAVWIAMAAFLVRLWVRQRRVNERLAQLDRHQP